MSSKPRLLLITLSITVLTMVSALFVILNQATNAGANAFVFRNTPHVCHGNHYDRREATEETPGCLEYWVCCGCHTHYLDEENLPEGSTWDEAGTAYEIVGDYDDRYIPIDIPGMLNTVLEESGESYSTLNEGMAILKSEGKSESIITGSSKVILYNEVSKQFIYEENIAVDKVLYDTTDLDYWIIKSSVSNPETYNVYASSAFSSKTVSIDNVGFDAGENIKIRTLTYNGDTEAKEIKLITNIGTNVVVNASDDTVIHYGKGEILTLDAASYVENGEMEDINVNGGEVTINEDAVVGRVKANINDMVLTTSADTVIATSSSITEDNTISVTATSSDITLIRDPLINSITGTTNLVDITYVSSASDLRTAVITNHKPYIMLRQNISGQPGIINITTSTVIDGDGYKFETTGTKVSGGITSGQYNTFYINDGVSNPPLLDIKFKNFSFENTQTTYNAKVDVLKIFGGLNSLDIKNSSLISKSQMGLKRIIYLTGKESSYSDVNIINSTVSTNGMMTYGTSYVTTLEKPVHFYAFNSEISGWNMFHTGDYSSGTRTGAGGSDFTLIDCLFNSDYGKNSHTDGYAVIDFEDDNISFLFDECRFKKYQDAQPVVHFFVNWSTTDKPPVSNCTVIFKNGCNIDFPTLVRTNGDMATYNNKVIVEEATFGNINAAGISPYVAEGYEAVNQGSRGSIVRKV